MQIEEEKLCTYEEDQVISYWVESFKCVFLFKVLNYSYEDYTQPFLRINVNLSHINIYKVVFMKMTTQDIFFFQFILINN